MRDCSGVTEPGAGLTSYSRPAGTAFQQSQQCTYAVIACMIGFRLLFLKNTDPLNPGPPPPAKQDTRYLLTTGAGEQCGLAPVSAVDIVTRPPATVRCRQFRLSPRYQCLTFMRIRHYLPSLVNTTAASRARLETLGQQARLNLH